VGWQGHPLDQGLGTEFCSEKIPRNRLGTVSIIPWKKDPIPRHSEVLQNSQITWHRIESMFFFREMLRNKIPKVCSFSESLLLFLFYGTGFRVVFIFHSSKRNSESLFLLLFLSSEFRAFFSSAEWVRNGIPRVCFYFFLR
jgi:hypothetical protein